MREGIQIESYSCCQWHDNPPVTFKCPHLKDRAYCSLYNTRLEDGYATDAWSGRDEYYVERCNQCKEQLDWEKEQQWD